MQRGAVILWFYSFPVEGILGAALIIRVLGNSSAQPKQLMWLRASPFILWQQRTSGAETNLPEKISVWDPLKVLEDMGKIQIYSFNEAF